MSTDANVKEKRAIAPMVEKIALGAALGAALLATLAGPGYVFSRAEQAISKSARLEERVRRGEYLVNTSGCHDCHTPWVMGPEGPAPDMTRALSGHPEDFVVTTPPDLGEGPGVVASCDTNTAYAGPWGISFTANLTPDVDTGIGIWTDEIFIETIRNGKHWGVSRPILPPMPWQVYRNMTDEDLRSIMAYLRTIPPVRNQVPLPILPEEEAH